MKWLTPEEVEGLTKYKQAQKQREALNQMGVNHVVRPDGSLVVFEADLYVVRTFWTDRTLV